MFTDGQMHNAMVDPIPINIGMNILAILKDGSTRQLEFNGIQWFTGPDVNNGVIVDAYSIRWWMELPDEEA